MSIVDVKPRRSTSTIDLGALCIQPTEPPCSNYFRWKWMLDRVLSLILLVPALPLMGLLIALIRTTSRGPGIYHQARVGKGGRIFTMYKLRTMRHDAESRNGAQWSANNDDRTTPLGRLLRKVHMDELPQLVNVLRGEMSLVGPRPERPEFVHVLAEMIPGYADRLAVLPGVTGLSQINLPPDTALDSVRKKQVLDLEYIRTAGLWLDVRMMLCTSLRLIGLSGVRASRLAMVARPVPILDEDQTGGSRSVEFALTPVALCAQTGPEPMDGCAMMRSDDGILEHEQYDRLLYTDASGNGNRGNHDSHRNHGNHDEYQQVNESRVKHPK